MDKIEENIPDDDPRIELYDVICFSVCLIPIQIPEPPWRQERVLGRLLSRRFRSGAVMGFLLAANRLLVLYVAIKLFNMYSMAIADNVGDIAGMGYDQITTCTESTCAALVFGSISSFGINHNCNALPLLISSIARQELTKDLTSFSILVTN
ncbi:hypothetical protein RHMOL_Rhmol01G0050400 [Rhododendron molle]|uniref:Uncharacterized protein n=1 Tax=Rhododendron molle TaxID=49168 RepID=A0ACC0PYH5_RHOML|nr:hypothetical protein RHMOL_Rhmol01G0050400 [Rhododendron molle]